MELVWGWATDEAYFPDYDPVFGTYLRSGILPEVNSRIITYASLINPVDFDRVPLLALDAGSSKMGLKPFVMPPNPSCFLVRP
ncbi:hypothetical protein PMIN04_012973 [Paraphaeosphaeria minitans]